MPTVSVVIPTYNRAELLTRAIDSVLAQTYDDFELLVVDDGSTDDTEEVVTGYDDERVRYLAHDTNRGANPARNTGIEAAEGEYVAFLDSDDEWRPRKLDAQLDRLDGTDDDWVAVYTDYDVTVPGAGGLVRETAADLLATDDEETPVEGGEELVGPTLADTLHTGAGSTLLVETEVARRIDGFDEELDWFQDPDFLLRVLLEGQLAHVPEPLVVRHYSGSPDAETAHAAGEEFLAKHDELVRRAERDGYDVRGAHDLVLAKYYLREGRFLRGVANLRPSSVGPRQVPSLAWFAATGSRRGRTLAVAAFVAMLLFARRSR
ncbi:glycosyltransferase [Halorussus salinus]|uniref:glycosyltransferase n=1 Tax=Halorussus salinus TaxID=1364935 RepID=UPI00109203F9|nr:glycosyltransferase [Halorussus salinus]